jgi:hypothetical protein
MVLETSDDTFVQWLVDLCRVEWEKNHFDIRRERCIFKCGEMRIEVHEGSCSADQL